MPVSAPPTSLDECLFSISLVSVPLAVRFSVSSGCARRGSVSTYAAILVPPSFIFFACSRPALPTPFDEEAIFIPFYAADPFVKN